MKKLSGLIIIVVFTTSCAHNKIRLSHKYKIDKHENEQVNSVAVKEIEAIDFEEAEVQSIEDSTVETSNDDFILSKEDKSSIILVDHPIKKITTDKKQLTSSKFKTIQLKDFDEEIKKDRNAENKIGFGIFFIVLAVIFLIFTGFSYLFFLVWAGFTVLSFFVFLLFLLLCILLLVNGIILVNKGNQIKMSSK